MNIKKLVAAGVAVLVVAQPGGTVAQAPGVDREVDEAAIVPGGLRDLPLVPIDGGLEARIVPDLRRDTPAGADVIPPPPGMEEARDPEAAPDLGELVELARGRSPTVQAARHRAEAAGARVPQVGALPDPQLSGRLMDVPVPDLSLSAEAMTMFSFQVSQELPPFGSRGAREAAAEHRYEAVLREVEAAEQEAVARVKAAYYELVFAEEADRVLRRNRELISDLAGVAGARLAVDGAPQQDVLRAHTEVTRLDEQLVELRSRRASARAEINAVVDREPHEPVAVSFPEEVEALALHAPETATFTAAALQEERLGPDVPTLAELQERALATRPALLAHMERIAAFGEARRAAQLERRPGVGWMVAYSPRVARQDMVSVGFSVDLPLFRDRKQNRAVAEAEAELADHEVRHHEMVAELRSEVADRYGELIRLRERILLLDDGVIPQAEATVESAVGAYQTGAMEFSGLLQAQAELFRNEIERARLLSDFGAELAALEEAVGFRIEPEEDR